MDVKKLLRNLTAGQGQILAPHIDAYLAKGRFPDKWVIEIPNHKVGDPHFHPSSDCFTLPSVLYRQRKGLEQREPIGALLRRTFDCGHMWHGYIQNILIEIGMVKPENVERYIVKKIVTKRGGFLGAGTGDLVDVQIPGQGSWLVDIKTMNKKDFEAGAPAHTLEKWQAQVNCYMDWFDAEKAMILAICKDSPHNFREYQIQRDQDLLDLIYDKWSYVAQCLRTNTEPEDDLSGRLH